MICILRELARVFSSYRSWYAGVAKRMPSAAPRDGGRGGGVTHVRAQRPAAQRPEADLAVVRRVRCLSEPCGNTRLAFALARAHRTRGITSDTRAGR